MKRHLSTSLLVSILVASPASLVARPVVLTSLVPWSTSNGTPGQITFFVYEGPDLTQPIAAETFRAGEWTATTTDEGVKYSVEFSGLDANSREGLWYQAEADGVVVDDPQPLALLASGSNLYVDGELETGTGIRFPDNTTQATAGITTETDPNLAAHAGNPSAHHSRYTNNEAWNTVLANDGPGSGLNADLLDGQQATAFAASAHTHDSRYVNVTGDTMTGSLVVRADTSVSDSAGNVQFRFDADGSGGGGVLRMYDGVGTASANNRIQINANDTSTDGSSMYLYNAAGAKTIELDADEASDEGWIRLWNGAGVATITLDADVGGDGRITTQELSLTGGSDISENFDIDSNNVVKPGMLVSIDPLNPGKLVLSKEAYDRKVAGIVSGAGGVKPGLTMGQDGTIANGEFPVALSGRVYAWVDADKGAVEPGDLLTTSNVPGYGMKATEHARSTGAIIGKAMTSLAKGTGLVLVLVSLQ